MAGVAIYRINLELNLLGITGSGILHEDDLRRVREEHPASNAAVFYMLLLKRFAGRIRVEEMMRRYTVALGLAFRDSGLGADEEMAQMEPFVERVIVYMEHLATVPQKNIGTDSHYVVYSSRFVPLVLPSMVPRNNADADHSTKCSRSRSTVTRWLRRPSTT